MRQSSKFLIGLGAVAGIALVAILLGWPGSQKTEPGSPLAPDEPAPPRVAETSTNASPSFAKTHPEPPHAPLTNGRPVRVSVPPAQVATNWEDKVDEILGSDSETPDKAKQLLELFPRAPEAGQLEIVKHLSNLLPDEDYERMVKLLADPQLPEDVLDELMADVLNRPNHLKLPALLEVARAPQHAKAAQAKEMLEFFLEADYGDDWAQWQAKIADWLKENPD